MKPRFIKVIRLLYETNFTPVVFCEEYVNSQNFSPHNTPSRIFVVLAGVA